MPGRGVHRGVYSSLLDSPEFQRLPPPTRHVFLTMRLAKQVGPAAIFVCYREVLSQQTGLPVHQVERCLGDLARIGWLACEGRVVWIVNGLKHDPTMRLANPKHRQAVVRALEELPRLEIVIKYCQYYGLECLFDSQSIANPVLVPPNTEYRGTTRIPKKTEDRRPSAANANAVLTDGQFTDALRGNAAYAGIDLDAELAKMDAWLLLPQNASRKKTRKFVVAWLNRIDKPMADNGRRPADRRRINDAWKDQPAGEVKL